MNYNETSRTFSSTFYRVDAQSGDLISAMDNQKIGICCTKEQEMLNDLHELTAELDDKDVKLVEYEKMLIDNGLIEPPVTIESLQADLAKAQERFEKSQKDNEEIKMMLTKLLSEKERTSDESVRPNLQPVGSKQRSKASSNAKDE